MSEIRTEIISQEKEVFDFPDAETWAKSVKAEFNRFPNHPSSRYQRRGNQLNKNGSRPFPNRKSPQSGYTSTMSEELVDCLKTRMANEQSSSVKKNGFSVFEQITGFYSIQVVDERTRQNQQSRLNQICELLTKSRYGLIDPLTGEEATIDTEYGERIAYSFMGGVNNPRYLTYSVLQEQKAEPILTDTLLESQMRGFIYNMVMETGELPELTKAFTAIMREGSTDSVFALMRGDAGGTRRMVGEILAELSDLDSSERVSMMQSFEVEEAEFKEGGGLERISKEISMKKFLTLDFDSEGTRTTLNGIRPPAEGLSAGSNWPVDSSGNYILHITQEPIQILCKSVNRAWDNSSCESLDSDYEYKAGSFDDIRWGNAIALAYNADDVMKDGEIVIDDAAILKCKGRFILRWGIGVSEDGSELGPRIGVERTVYSVNGKNPSWQSTLGQGLINVLESKGLWDFQSVRTPYNYKGYSDVNSGRGRITYGKVAFGVQEGTGLAGERDEGLPDYSGDETLSFAEFQRLIDSIDNDRVRISLAENPMVYVSDRIIGNLMTKIWNFYEDENKERLLYMLVGHRHGTPSLLLPALEGLDALVPDYMNMSQGNLLMAFIHHNRSDASVHYKVRELIGEDADLWYLLPQGTVDAHSLIFAPQDIMDSVVETYKVILSGGDTFERFKELTHRYQPQLMDMVDESMLFETFEQLISQPNLSQEKYNELIQLALESDRADYISNAMAQMVYPYGEPENYGWTEDFSDLESVFRKKNYDTRIPMVDSLDFIFNNFVNQKEFSLELSLISFFTELVVSSPDTEDSKKLFDWLMSVKEKSEEGYWEDWAGAVCAFMLKPAGLNKPSNTRRTPLVPNSAFVPLLNLVVDSPNGEEFIDAIFVKSMNYANPTKYLNFLFNGDEPPKLKEEIPADLAYAMIVVPTVLDMVDISKLARTLPPVDELFYLLEEAVFSTYLGDLYTPDGERPFKTLAPEEFQDFTILLTLNNGLPKIAELFNGFMENENTPDEIMERLIQKPRLNSVGYRRLFDYYGISENPLTTMGVSDEESFRRRFIPQLAKKKNISGRLLRYLWDNYPDQHSELMMNPNLVEARLYDTVIGFEPIGVLKNSEVGSRAYRKHIRKLMESMTVSIPSTQQQNTFGEFIRNVGDRFSHLNTRPERFQSAFSGMVNDSGYQFLRAGRSRWSSGLPTAPEGATEQNLSNTGSIIEYPQIIEDKPFILLRYLTLASYDLNTRKENWEGVSLRNPNVSLETLFQYGFLPEGDADGADTVALLGMPHTYEAREVVFDEEGEIYSSNSHHTYYSPIMVLEAEMIRESSRSGSGTIYERGGVAKMLGIEVQPIGENGYSLYPIDRIMTNNREEARRFKQALMRFKNNVKLKYNRSMGRWEYATEADREVQEMDTTPDDLDATNILIQFQDRFRRLAQNYNPEDDVVYRILNGEQNLEEMFGWISPEEKAEMGEEGRQLRNYTFSDNSVNMRDSISTFKYDFVGLLTKRGLDYGGEEIETVDLPDWRLSLSAEKLSNFIRYVGTSRILSLDEKYNIYRDLVEFLCADSNNLLMSDDSRSGISQIRYLSSDVKYMLGMRNIRFVESNRLDAVRDSGNTVSIKESDYSLGLLIQAMCLEETGRYLGSPITFDIQKLTKEIVWDGDYEGTQELLDAILVFDENEFSMTYNEAKKALTSFIRRDYRKATKLRYLNYKVMNRNCTSDDEIPIPLLNKDKRYPNYGMVPKFDIPRFVGTALCEISQAYINYLRPMDVAGNIDAGDLYLMVNLLRFSFPDEMRQNMDMGRWEQICSQMKSLKNNNLFAFLQATEELRGSGGPE